MGTAERQARPRARMKEVGFDPGRTDYSSPSSASPPPMHSSAVLHVPLGGSPQSTEQAPNAMVHGLGQSFPPPMRNVAVAIRPMSRSSRGIRRLFMVSLSSGRRDVTITVSVCPYVIVRPNRLATRHESTLQKPVNPHPFVRSRRHTDATPSASCAGHRLSFQFWGNSKFARTLPVAMDFSSIQTSAFQLPPTTFLNLGPEPSVTGPLTLT